MKRFMICMIALLGVCLVAHPGVYMTRLVEFTWAIVSPGLTGQLPDMDTVMDIGQAASLLAIVDTTAAANLSTDIDINVHESLDGTVFTTTPRTMQTGVGDSVVIAFPILLGAKHVRLRLDNNDMQTASVTVQVFVREERE